MEITYEQLCGVIETDDGTSHGPFTATRATRTDGKVAVVLGTGPTARRLARGALDDLPHAGRQGGPTNR